ncbi:10749_t:CDS:1 [Acaulospora morrowiae]|uniref:10749_t:CDS:1 n=1 Tax=Acaulospora morrowiae TaxID=94023 RepID=A0A9N8ZUV8_9GLOM|nr:10749_t:CDS:1 [Acaulospora morrowiae]
MVCTRTHDYGDTLTPFRRRSLSMALTEDEDTISDDMDLDNERFIDEPSVPTLSRQRHRRVLPLKPVEVAYIEDVQHNRYTIFLQNRFNLNIMNDKSYVFFRSEQGKRYSWQLTFKIMHMLFVFTCNAILWVPNFLLTMFSRCKISMILLACALTYVVIFMINSKPDNSLAIWTPNEIASGGSPIPWHTRLNLSLDELYYLIATKIGPCICSLYHESGIKSYLFLDTLTQAFPEEVLEKLHKIIVPIVDKIMRDRGQVESRTRNRADFALHSGGARVLLHLTSPPYVEYPGGFIKRSIARFLGRGITRTKQPEIVISADNNVGNCYCFRGETGHVAIELSRSIELSSITYVHLDPDLAFEQKDLSSAPKDFEMWVIRDGNMRDNKEQYNTEALLLGKFRYELGGVSEQKFDINYEGRVIPVVKKVLFKVNSNWGEEKYTCLYQIKVHGRVVNR